MSGTILRAQLVADLALELSTVTSAERAMGVVRGALRATGLSHTPVLDEGDVDSLLQAIAADGGLVESIAQQIATEGIATYIARASGASTIPDKKAA